MEEQPEYDIGAVVYRRTSMDALADLLIDEVCEEFGRGGDFFRKIQVIVPNRSIQRYLSLRFAHRHGAAAQIEFASLMSVFRRFMPKSPAPGRLDIDEKTIGWRIYRILLEPESKDVFPVLTRWIGGDAKKLYELSCQLGTLYDKYLLYRPEWINAWESGGMPRGLEREQAAAWQGELWRRIAGEDWKGCHFAAVYGRIRRGEVQAVPGAADAETIRIFGFSQLPPAVLRCLECFSSLGMAVKVYHLAPSAAFYADSRTHKEELREFLNRYFRDDQDPDQLQKDMQELYFQHNPLLASFATQSRILFSGTINWPDNTDYDPAAVPPALEAGPVLRRLQDRVRNDRAGSCLPLKHPFGERNRRSIQIRSCYSAFREVEAAHNFILHCLDEDPALSMKDIFIMTPSPSEYAPLVDAVFNHSHDTMRSAQGKELRLAVSVADRPQTERLPSYSTWMKILSLYKGDFASSELFGILQDQELEAHWAISAEDVQYCLNRSVQAGIRWGWDAEEHLRSGGKAFPENSWQAGFDRMLLDYAMDADPAAPYRINETDTVFPVPGFEGGRADLLGRFISLTTQMHELAQIMRGRERNGVPFGEWKTTLADFAGALFGRDSQLKILLMSVLNGWDQILAESGTEDVPLTSGIVLAYLQDKHARPEDNTMGFMRGKITFCGLRPMRSIPAGAILLLGMNHDVFPEEDDSREFDIMQQYRKSGAGDSSAGRIPGDPVRRDESRQLFLDTVMAARDYLYISYIGRDNHDRKEKPPSVCVDELKTYLAQTFGKDSFVDIQEPVHAFSPDLFRDGAPNQSYSTTLLAAAEQIANPARDEEKQPLFRIRPGLRAPGPGEGNETQGGACGQRVDFNSLATFFRNPAQAFVRDGLGADVSVSGSAASEDSEMFEGSLDWSWKEELLQLCLETDEMERPVLKHACLQRLKANGAIPLTQQEDDWDDWAEILLLVHETESLTQGGKEPIPAEEIVLEYSAADAEETSDVLDPAPGGLFRTTLDLPELTVCPPGGPDGPCLQVIPCFVGDQISGAQLIGPLMNHLRANLNRATRTRIVYKSKKDVSYLDADAMARADAKAAVKRLLYLYRAGLCAPLPFFPNSSYKLFKTKDEVSAESVWNGNPNAEGEKKRFRAFFGDDMPDPEQVEVLATAVFGAVAFHEAKGGPA